MVIRLLRRLFQVLAPGLLLFLSGSIPSRCVGQTISFNRDIRPILSEHCFQCHGPDEKQRHGGIRFDRYEDATAAGESGKQSIVPGNVDSSALWHRVTSDDPETQMPPADFGKPLRGDQKDKLRRWIESGAEYQGHWAFHRVERPDVPLSNEAEEYPNPIDHFLLERLRSEGFAFSPKASRETLIRRVTLDLIGLPPTLDEIDDFVRDKDANAYEKVVDRLLASPQYGERMAMTWLDLARYADSNGFQIDSSRQQWPWRDWVIDAFNQNMPFDQFTIEQIAGDLLPNATLPQIIATGFHRNHRLNGEGGIIQEEWRIETVIDRVETTGLSWLGLTLNCCRCHDHKYDPISQREFYSFFSYFNNIAESGTLQGESRNTEPVVSVPSPQLQEEWSAMDREVHAKEAELQALEVRLPELVAAWEPEFREQLESQKTSWVTLAPTSTIARSHALLTRQADDSYLVSGENPEFDVYTISAPIAAGEWSGLLLECFPDSTLPQQSLGRYSNGNFVLSRIEAEIRAPSLAEPTIAKLTRAEADYSQNGWDIQFTVKPEPGKGWAVDGPTRKETCRAMLFNETPIAVPSDATITIRLVQESLNQHNIGRFRLSCTALPQGAVGFDGARVSDSLRTVLATEPKARTVEQTKQIEDFYKSNTSGPFRKTETELQTLRTQREEQKKKWPSVMVMQEIDAPRQAFVLMRGEYDKRGDAVTPAIPSVFPSLPDNAPNNRLGLARWIAHRENPLTARVWVNRAWEKFMGNGLVKTTENLGSQSEWPSHPELLDWLAIEFMEPSQIQNVAGHPVRAWDMKAIQKLIVLSAAYQQSSSQHQIAVLQERDPDNRWMGRGPRFRLSGEAIRDQALHVSGLLSKRLGGPSVRPYMPDGVWDETSVYGDLRNYQHDRDEGLYRRSLYTVWKRTAAPPTMLLFDAPSREICTVSRSRTNTPLQALSLLNEVTFVEAARKLGERMLLCSESQMEGKLRYGFRLVTGRFPSPAELDVLELGWREDLQHFQAHPEEAERMLQHGESVSSTDRKPELAAFMLAGNVLLNLDECVMRE
jgi:hypothetical protein